jgi:1-acyl-sn-glycerol-3-phosphate acyltransferase
LDVDSPDDTTSGPEYIRPYGGLVGALRAVLRTLGILLVTIITLVTWGVVSLWPRDAAGSAAVRRRVSRRWAAACCRLIGLRIRLEGAPPKGPGFLVSNHVSYLDIPVLMSLTGCTFVAKREIADWPVIGSLARRGGTLFVNRAGGRDTAQTLEGMARSKANGDLVMFFPEGTTSRGEGILPFRSGLLALAADNGVPVEAAAVAYSTTAEIDEGLGLAWSGDQEFTPHAWRLLRLPSVDVRVALAPETMVAADRKALARKLHARVCELLASVSSGNRLGGPARQTESESA